MIVFPDRVQPHVPLRPLWICRSCAGPWPCPIARLTLKGEYHDDRPALAVFMSTVLHEATAELSKLANPGPPPEELFTRFVEWTRPRLRW